MRSSFYKILQSTPSYKGLCWLGCLFCRSFILVSPCSVFSFSFSCPSSSSATRYSAFSFSSQRRKSKMRCTSPLHFFSMKSMASSLPISITFNSFSALRSPIITNFSAVNLAVTINFLVPISRILTTSKSSLALAMFLSSSNWMALCFFLRGFWMFSMTMGQLAMLLIIFLVFLHCFLYLSRSQSDFLSCSLRSILAFQTSMLCDCFFLKLEFKLRFICDSELPRLLPIIVVIFSSNSLFSLSISVNLSYLCISFFLGFSVRKLSLVLRNSVLGLACFRFCLWFSRSLSCSMRLSTLLAKGCPLYIRSQIIIGVIKQMIVWYGMIKRSRSLPG